MKDPAVGTASQLSLHSPVGDLTISAWDGGIVAIDWGWGRDQTTTLLLTRARDALERYFDGLPLADDLPLAPAHGTSYRRRVWAYLRAIPTGQTRTYGDVARGVGGCARAVGAANAHNPIPILIPCHRVVADAGLGGYSGGDGQSTKRYLLMLEAGLSWSDDSLFAAPTRCGTGPACRRSAPLPRNAQAARSQSSVTKPDGRR